MHKLFGTVATIGLCLASQVALAQGAGQPTDPQIAHIAYTAGEIDIKAAEQALKKSKNRDVRAFAKDMVRDHKAVNAQALALVKQLNVKPEDNPTSRSLVQQAEAKRQELASLKGAAFDRAYAASEVAYHQQVNGALQTTLIPAASNGELKNLLQTGLKIFQGHEQHAAQLVNELSSRTGAELRP
jgi:putative membrane protein